MLVGYPPFYDDNPFGIYEKILSGKIDWPRHMDPIAKDLVKKLLVPDRTKRIGNMKNGAEDIKRHRWFKHLDWDEVFNKKQTVSCTRSANCSSFFRSEINFSKFLNIFLLERAWLCILIHTSFPACYRLTPVKLQIINEWSQSPFQRIYLFI